MERLKQSLVLSILSVFSFCGYVFSEEPATEAKMELKQVALFKNGLGFFVSEVTIPEKVKSFYIVPPAAASHGTFWVSYPAKVKMNDIIAKEIEIDKQVEATTIPELLRLNIGKKAKFYLAGSPIEAKIINISASSNLTLLETDQGLIAIESGRIDQVLFAAEKPSTTSVRKDKALKIQVELEAAAGREKLTLSCLAKGAAWAPSYMIDITAPDKAQLAAKAEIMDEVCDLNGVFVQLVTGFPNLQFADVVSPLARKENLSQFLQSLIRGQSEQGQARGVLSNVMTQSMAYDRMAGEQPVMPAYGAAEVGKTAEDLFLYPLENVRLSIREVGYFPLFTESVPYKHIYRWEIPDYVNPEGQYYEQQGRQREPEQQEVWHCIRLENVMKLPWTTAPAEIVKDGVILGQDTLNFTPVKDKGTVKITRAMNVKAEQIELEKDRKRDAGHWYNYSWDLVTVDGKLSVTNYQDKPITLEVTKMLLGEVKAMRPEAKLEKLAKALRAVNSNVRLTWTIELAAGEKKEIEYTYEVYVRR